MSAPGMMSDRVRCAVHQLEAALVDHAGQVGDKNVLDREAEVDDQVEAGQGRGAGAGDDQLAVLDVLADHLQAVQDGGADDDRGAVLVVVEDRDLHALAQLALDVEALRRLDVFQVHAAEGRLERGDDVDQFIGVAFVDLDVENVDRRELLEQHALAFHDRLGSQWADVAQAEDGGAVRDHGNQVAARGVLVRCRRVLDDFLARGRDAGRIGQRQVALVQQALGRGDGDLAGAGKLVVFERCSTQLLA